MITLISFINKKIAIETVIAQIFILLVIICLLFFRKKYDFIFKFIAKNGMFFAFIASLAATAGSLYYSQIVGFTPCELCWFQRIFMYPLVILLGLALIRRDYSIIDYALSISIIGFLTSLYHNYIYYYNGGLNALCQLAGINAVSCAKRYIFEFGYITIPLMALTAFALIVIFLILSKIHNEKIYK